MSWLKRVRRPFSPLGRALRRSLRPPDYRTLLKRVDALERNAESALMARHAQQLGERDARRSLRSHEFKVYSQNGEDGLLLYLLSRVGSTDRRVVEFGIGQGSECNSANLILNFGWSGLLMDCGRDNVAAARRFYHDERGISPERVHVARETITAENIDEVLARHGVKGELDLLSIDIDSNDYWVWKAIRSIEPRLVVIEYNASLGCDAPRITRYAPEFDARAHHPRGWYHGASLPALAALGERRGFVLVGCDSMGVNAFFVRRDLARGVLPELAAADAYYPHARRLDRASQAEQWASLAECPYDSD